MCDSSDAVPTLPYAVIYRILRKRLYRKRGDHKFLVTDILYHRQFITEPLLFHKQVVIYSFKFTLRRYALRFFEQVNAAAQKTGEMVYQFSCFIRLVKGRAYGSKTVVYEVRLYLRDHCFYSLLRFEIFFVLLHEQKMQPYIIE